MQISKLKGVGGRKMNVVNLNCCSRIQKYWGKQTDGKANKKKCENYEQRNRNWGRQTDRQTRKRGKELRTVIARAIKSGVKTKKTKKVNGSMKERKTDQV